MNELTRGSHLAISHVWNIILMQSNYPFPASAKQAIVMAHVLPKPIPSSSSSIARSKHFSSNLFHSLVDFKKNATEQDISTCWTAP